MNYQMPVKAIKNILGKELESHRDGFYHVYPNFIMSDFQKNMIDIAYHCLKDVLELCNSYEELDSYIGRNYRMSLEEWINSL